MSRIAKDVAALMERDPGLRCAYCAIPLALPPSLMGSNESEWEGAGWELRLLPDGEPVWQLGTGEALAHRDHVVPASRGGADTLDNLVLACDGCNLEKKARALLIFLAIRAGCPRYKSVGGAPASLAWTAA